MIRFEINTDTNTNIFNNIFSHIPVSSVSAEKTYLLHYIVLNNSCENSFRNHRAVKIPYGFLRAAAAAGFPGVIFFILVDALYYYYYHYIGSIRVNLVRNARNCVRSLSSDVCRYSYVHRVSTENIVREKDLNTSS